MDTQALLDKYPIEAHKDIHQLRVDIFKQEQLKALGESPAGKFVIEYLNVLIDGINKELVADKPMTETARLLLLEKRRCYQIFVGLFQFAERRLEGLEQFAQEKLSE